MIENLNSKKQDTYALAIILYYPDVDTIEYLNNLKHKIDNLIIFDNTPDSDIKNKLNDGVIYLTNFKNMGIAHALNECVKASIEMELNYIFLFDQDSRIGDEYINEMLNFKKQHKNSFICASDFIDINTGQRSRFAKLHKWNYENKSQKLNGDFFDVTFVITSGSLLDLAYVSNVGYFKNDFFIDHVDSDFCMRAHIKNLKIMVNAKVVLRHAIGKRTTHRFCGLVIKPNHHNPARRYYIFRNSIKMLIDYGWKYPSFVLLYFARMTHDLLGIILYENNRYIKLKAIFWGVMDAFRGRMGPAPSCIE